MHQHAAGNKDGDAEFAAGVEQMKGSGEMLRPQKTQPQHDTIRGTWHLAGEKDGGAELAVGVKGDEG